MADHIENEGKKGRVILYIFLAIFLFLITWVYVYQRNGEGVPGL